MALTLFFLLLFTAYSDCHFFLFQEVEAPAGDLTLSQLGQLSCSDQDEQRVYDALSKSLRLTILYPATPPIDWKKQYIQVKWEQMNRSHPIFFAGSESVHIKPMNSSFTQDEFRRIVEEEIRKQLPDDRVYQIQFKNFPNGIDIPSENYRFEFLTSRVSRGHLRVKLFHDERLIRQLFLNFKILSRQGIFRTLSPLIRGENLNPKNLQISEEFISIQETPLSPNLLLDLPQMQVRKNVPAGAVLSKRDVEYKTIVRRNQRLKGIYRQGTLRIDLQVISLSNGKKDEIIEVQAQETRKKFQARVIDSRTVEINF